MDSGRIDSGRIQGFTVRRLLDDRGSRCLRTLQASCICSDIAFAFALIINAILLDRGSTVIWESCGAYMSRENAKSTRFSLTG